MYMHVIMHMDQKQRPCSVRCLGRWPFRLRLLMRCWTQFEHPARPIRTVRMERDRVLWKMVGSARRPDGCRRRADVPAERKAMRRSALHAALRRSSFGHEEAVAGRAGGPWELVRRDERRPGRLGRLIGQLPVRVAS